MADNITARANTGTGTEVLAADDVSGVLYPRVKLSFGADGSAGDVTSGNPLPVDVGTVAVTGTFWQATQPVSIASPVAVTGPLTDTELRATPVPVSGTFWQATQPVSGTVTANAGTGTFAVSGPLTDAQLRATAVSVTDANAATETTLAALLAIAKAEDSASVSGDKGFPALAMRYAADTPTTDTDGDYTVLKVDEEGRLKVASKPASYSATTGNITANGQTVYVNCERFSNLMVHCTGTFSTVNVTFEGSLNSTNGTDGNWFTVQAVRSNANTIETTTGNLSSAPAYAWELSVNALRFFRVRATAFTSGTQVWTFVPGTYATEPIPAAQISGTQPVSGTVTATVTAGTVNPVVPATPYFVNSAASTNGALILTGTSGVHAFYATNEGASVAYVKLYNKATAPTVGTDVPEMIIPVPAAAGGVPGVATLPIGFAGFRFALGLGIAITRNAVHTDTTAVGAGEVKVKLSRTV